jgi:hypothetical protein
MVVLVAIVAACGGSGSSSEPSGSVEHKGVVVHHHRHHHAHGHHHHHQAAESEASEEGGSESHASEAPKSEEPAHHENKSERGVDRVIRQAEESGIGNDMPGLDYAMEQQAGWSHNEAESFTKLMSAAGLSEKVAQEVAAGVLVSEEQGTSHKDAVAAMLEIYGALGGLGE